MNNTTAIHITARYALGIVFILSGFVKLFPIDVLEINIVRFSFFSWQQASIIARILIGFEIALGLCIISTLFYKTTLYISSITLLCFSMFLLYLHFIIGYTESCGCFGALLSLSPPQSLLKNAFLLCITYFLLRTNTSPKHEKSIQIYAAIGLIIIVSFGIPFIVAFPKKNIESNYILQENKKTESKLLADFTDNTGKTHKLLTEKRLIVFLSLHCKACKLAATKIAVLQEAENAHKNIFFIFLETENTTEDLAAFHAETQSQNIPYAVFNLQDFYSVSDVYLPFLVYLNNGYIKHLSNYKDMHPSHISTFFSTNKKTQEE